MGFNEVLRINTGIESGALRNTINKKLGLFTVSNGGCPHGGIIMDLKKLSRLKISEPIANQIDTYTIDFMNGLIKVKDCGLYDVSLKNDQLPRAVRIKADKISGKIVSGEINDGIYEAVWSDYISVPAYEERKSNPSYITVKNNSLPPKSPNFESSDSSTSITYTYEGFNGGSHSGLMPNYGLKIIFNK